MKITPEPMDLPDESPAPAPAPTDAEMDQMYKYFHNDIDSGRVAEPTDDEMNQMYEDFGSDIDSGRYDDDPSPYDGTYSEE